jgi:uncharacterized repeat protein (TIGR01451 family)
MVGLFFLFILALGAGGFLGVIVNNPTSKVNPTCTVQSWNGDGTVIQDWNRDELVIFGTVHYTVTITNAGPNTATIDNVQFLVYIMDTSKVDGHGALVLTNTFTATTSQHIYDYYWDTTTVANGDYVLEIVINCGSGSGGGNNAKITAWSAVCGFQDGQGSTTMTFNPIWILVIGIIVSLPIIYLVKKR